MADVIEVADSDNKVIDFSIDTVFGTSVRSIEQTFTSKEDDGINEITCELTNDQTSKFYIKNGSKGEKGDKGDKGDAGGTTEEVNSEIKRIVETDQTFLDKMTDIIEKRFLLTKVGVKYAGNGLLKFTTEGVENSGTITDEEREFWNNKVTAYSSKVKNETLVLTKNKE